MKKSILILITILGFVNASNAQASLPTYWNFSTPIISSPPNGWTVGLGTNGSLTYSGSSNSVGGDNLAARFDANNEFITIWLGSITGQISYWLKGTGINPTPAFTGVYKIQESADSIIWKDMRTFTTSIPLNGTMTRYVDTTSINSRYIRFFYDTKESGSNVALDSVLILPKKSCINPTLSISIQDTLIGFKTANVKLLGNNYNSTYSYIWDNNVNIYNDSFNNLPSTKYYLTFFDTLGHCGIDSLQVAFINGINEKDTFICNGTSKELSIKNIGNGYKYLWNTNDTTSSIKVSPNSNTTYSCIQKFGSFSMIDSVRVTVNALPNIISLLDTTIAFKQDSILLNAGAGYSKYVWTRGDTTQSIWVKTTGMNKVTVFNSAGCSNSDSTRVLFVKGIQQKDTSICLGKSINLSIFSSASNIPSNGLVAWYPFNGNANDASGNSNNLTSYGGTSLTSDRNGLGQKAYYLNGINGYLKTNSSCYNYSSNHTISFWFKIEDTLQTTQTFFSSQQDGIEIFSFTHFAASQPKKASLFLGNISNWNIAYNYPVNLNNIQSWSNLTYVKNGLNYYFYLNGKLVDTLSTTQNLPSYISPMQFGSSPSGEYFNGKLDDIGIWNRAITQSEIQALYSGVNINTKVNWSTSDTTNSISVTPTTSTTYRCTQRIGSFTMTDSIRVTVRNLPSKTITYNKKGLCKNDTISINASPGYAYNWYKNNNIIGGTNNTLKAFANGNYKAKLTDSTGCSTISDSVILFNAPLPIVNISLPDTALCLNGNVFKYTDSTTLDSGSFNRNWTFGNGNTSTLSTSNQSYNSAGNYVSKLKVTTNYGCADSTIKNITVKPNPVAGIMLGQVINLNPSTPYIYTVAQQPNHLYNWVVKNGLVVLGQSTNAATVQWINNGNGYIKVEVTNQQECLDTTAITTKIGTVGMNETSTINNLSLYPNPNHGSFNVGFTLKESSTTKLELINMLGQQVWGSNLQLQNGEQQIPINLSLSAGVYVLKITTSTGEITKQVLVK